MPILRLLATVTGLLMLAESAQIQLTSRIKPMSQEMIDYINNHPKSTWRASPSLHFKSKYDAIIRLGAKMKYKPMKHGQPKSKTHNKRVTFPESFDARIRWPNCPTIGQIRDQSNCGSHWAFGAVEAMSDRICIHSNATIHVELSARELISCCLTCGFGCDGGYPAKAWDYWFEDGIVTGGSFEHATGCQPYPFPSCEHHTTGSKPPCEKDFKTPVCNHICNGTYNVTFIKDKHYGKQPYLLPTDESEIMEELINNGPIEVTFNLYEDFLNYKSGIYQHMRGGYLGFYAVKLLGWGSENGTKYWLLANSWNEDWGEGGFFRILRGVNECGIESEAIAAIPDFTKARVNLV